MDLRTLSQSVARSRTARRFGWVVLLIMLSSQLVFMLLSLWAQHQDAVQRLIDAERNYLQLALRQVYAGDISDPANLLGDALVGFALYDSAGTQLFTIGEPTGTRQITRASSYRQSSSALLSVDWQLATLGGQVNARAIIDTQPVRLQTVVSGMRQLTFALLASLLATLATMYGVLRCYVEPLVRLGECLRTSRKHSQGAVPAPMDESPSEDLDPLVAEFNLLLDEQRKVARQVKVKQQYLEFAAHHDPLTHLPNRLMFEDTLKRTVGYAQQHGEPFAVFLVDLDNFKFFNDQYGHVIGDKMVAEIGNRLRRMIRESDLVARLDGDEFVMIQKNVKDTRSAEEVAQRVMRECSKPYDYRGFSLKAAVSVGISRFPADVHGDQDDELKGEEIVNNASVALQHAKSSGRNRHQLFTESMREELTARIRLEQDLKIALQEGQFEVYYQPKIDIRSRQITGAEALVRWLHPDEGFISPETFVPVAEEAGMIIELGEWILRTACEQTHLLHERGFRGLNVAVNISAVQFTDGNLLPMVSQALADTQLRPEMLELEITESAVMHDPEEVIRSLHELSRFGMRLAIDDFGTGYSSLAYMKRFPVDTLKIDRAFITDISSDTDDVAIVEAVLGLGEHFNLKVVAEGVEDEQQLQFLQKQGCDLAQGYFIGKPMKLDDYIGWLERWPYGVQKLQSPQRQLRLAAGGD